MMCAFASEYIYKSGARQAASAISVQDMSLFFFFTCFFVVFFFLSGVRERDVFDFMLHGYYMFLSD